MIFIRSSPPVSLMNFTSSIIIYLLPAIVFHTCTWGSIGLFLAAGRFVGVCVYFNAVAM